jgi:hypothetical protein
LAIEKVLPLSKLPFGAKSLKVMISELRSMPICGKSAKSFNPAVPG